MIETRGRTGRKLEPLKPSAKEAARQRRADRFDRPPTWRSSVNRAAIAALFFGIVTVLLLGRTVVQAALLAAFMLLLYIPLGYYTDRFMYRRRVAREARRTTQTG